MSHSKERMRDPAVLAVKQRVELVGDRALVVPDAPRSGYVEVTLRDGRRVEHFTRHPPGTKENPLDTARVQEKARGLIGPVLGRAKTDAVIAQVDTIERVPDIREVIAQLTV
jgi:2-methylcitrate dehydratase PrpD